MNINSQYRTVSPEHEISIIELAPSSIKRRLDSLSSLHTNDEKTLRYGKLAINAFKGRKPSEKVMQVMYSNMDNYIKRLGVTSKSICRKGCAQCCTQPVSMTSVEAKYISDTYGIDASFDSSRTSEGMCPFNKDNQCSIYSARPIECRLFHAFESPVLCYEDRGQSTFSIESEPYFSALQREMSELGDREGIFDIRHWFA
ncbi:YkgJ family cysteine cluster protein [Vibrio marisflavi]|uniref:YkgJ family cysteine cluster protein n=1 Tax=Vibrio marisflavi CECT 7928 TaxID=634439 RepID=A0ABM9A9L2_9VIBR|nr:YkgJ family cysteine cluster protein [Vibrio marisflavi]CAH0542979.1 hypothetical protein VMF7928_04343 [Vibrio marisflavi CECT 7928]